MQTTKRNLTGNFYLLSVYGTVGKCLSGNGGEFANGQFLEMCEEMNITFKTTPAESPWSNGLVERHNAILSTMLDNVLEDGTVPFDIAVQWCVNAKNSLCNVSEFSPYQLAIGLNPILPSCLDRPGHFKSSTSHIIRNNLNALHKARKAFIECETSEKLQRAMRHNVSSTSDTIYVTGDSVYYKREGNSKWRGPATVIGHLGQQVLIQHGAFTVRVHKCRLQHVNDHHDPSQAKQRAVLSESESESEGDVSIYRQWLSPLRVERNRR